MCMSRPLSLSWNALSIHERFSASSGALSQLWRSSCYPGLRSPSSATNTASQSRASFPVCSTKTPPTNLSLSHSPSLSHASPSSWKRLLSDVRAVERLKDSTWTALLLCSVNTEIRCGTCDFVVVCVCVCMCGYASLHARHSHHVVSRTTAGVTICDQTCQLRNAKQTKHLTADLNLIIKSASTFFFLLILLPPKFGMRRWSEGAAISNTSSVKVLRSRNPPLVFITTGSPR